MVVADFAEAEGALDEEVASREAEVEAVTVVVIGAVVGVTPLTRSKEVKSQARVGFRTKTNSLRAASM